MIIVKISKNKKQINSLNMPKVWFHVIRPDFLKWHFKMSQLWYIYKKHSEGVIFNKF